MAAYLSDAQKVVFAVQRIADIFFTGGRGAGCGRLRNSRRNPAQAFQRIPAAGGCGCDLKTLKELSGLDHRDRSQF